MSPHRAADLALSADCSSTPLQPRQNTRAFLVNELIDDVPRVLRLERPGHKRGSTDERYSHVTAAMISRMLEQLQRR